ncbi:MAG: arginine--tRNA ligase [Patescibacteria group bacterium]
MSDISKLIKENIKKAVKSLYGIEIEDAHSEHPENESFGDYASSVSLSISKDLKRIPIEVAEEISHELSSYKLNFESDGSYYSIFSSIKAAQPGFVNFKLSQEWLKQQLVEVFNKSSKYGSNDMGKDKTIIVEYSQPNPNKPMHIGHSRNNFIGSSLSEIFKFCNYHVIKMNYMDDWGTHICKSMLMYKKYKNGEEPTTKSDHYVGDLYIMYEKEHESNPKSLEKELSEMFRKLEDYDPETIELWKKIVNWVYEGWKATYQSENVTFDVWTYQSEHTKGGKEIVNLAVEKGVAERDETGAVIARLEKYGIPDKVLLRSDGTSIYITQDTQLAKDNFEKYRFDKRFYVVDCRQSGYFIQLFKILDLLGFEWAKRLYHVAYGTVSLPDGSMSSRLGNVVNADEVFQKLVDLEEDEARNSLKDISNLKETSKKVALAAYRYGMLKVDSKQDIVFDYSKVTKFEGNTGPYLMYSYARAKSLLEKAGIGDEEMDFNLKLFGDTELVEKETSILRSIYQFPEVVLESADNFMPHVIANYLYDLAQRFNSFYADTPVLNAKEETKEFRLALVKGFSQVIKNGLSLLGIDVVEKM